MCHEIFSLFSNDEKERGITTTFLLWAIEKQSADQMWHSVLSLQTPDTSNKIISNRLNAEANMKIQLSSTKIDIKEIYKM